MKIPAKLAIFLAAALLTLVGFSLIAGPSLPILKVGHQAGYEMIARYLTNAQPTALPKG
jgi:hypothetical protein